LLLERLSAFVTAPSDDTGFRSFIAAFRGPVPASEEEFEGLLWRQLDLLRELDASEWDPAVSNDPTNPHFCFSVAGTAAFVIGMHPLASRLARRSPLPVLVFNPHAQFERLRARGGYDRVRDVVRRRDAKLQGTINPMVADHGQGSEARQYSGREVDAGWRAPLT
jgi:FPC/CPF motif-containing protein YcgG